MGNYNSDRKPNGFGGGRSGGFGGGGGRSGGGFGGRSAGGRSGGFGGGRDGGRPQMHQATCAECGDRCEVPFKPTGDKPVYCSNCFGNSPNYGSDRAKGGRDFDRRDSRGPQMHQATCAECGDRCEVPFKPNGEKPVYCSDCFGGEPRENSRKDTKSKPYEGGNASDAGMKEEVKQLSLKLDKVLALLQRTNSVKEVTVMKASEGKMTEKGASKSAEKPMAKKVEPKKAEPVKKIEDKKSAPKKVSEVKKTAPAKKTVTKKKATPKKK